MTIQFTRIHSDINGNPRYVCHFLNFIKASDDQPKWMPIDQKYSLAVSRANKLGGRKYNTKAYGGGIVFQSYSLKELENSINKLLAE